MTQTKGMLSYLNPSALSERTDKYLTMGIGAVGTGLLLYAPFTNNPRTLAAAGLCGIGVGLLHTYQLNSLRQGRDVIEHPGRILDIR